MNYSSDSLIESIFYKKFAVGLTCKLKNSILILYKNETITSNWSTQTSKVDWENQKLKFKE